MNFSTLINNVMYLFIEICAFQRIRDTNGFRVSVSTDDEGKRQRNNFFKKLNSYRRFMHRILLDMFVN